MLVLATFDSLIDSAKLFLMIMPPASYHSFTVPGAHKLLRELSVFKPFADIVIIVPNAVVKVGLTDIKVIKLDWTI